MVDSKTIDCATLGFLLRNRMVIAAWTASSNSRLRFMMYRVHPVNQSGSQPNRRNLSSFSPPIGLRASLILLWFLYPDHAWRNSSSTDSSLSCWAVGADVAVISVALGLDVNRVLLPRCYRNPGNICEKGDLTECRRQNLGESSRCRRRPEELAFCKAPSRSDVTM